MTPSSLSYSADEIRQKICDLALDNTITISEKLVLLKKYENQIRIIERGDDNVNAII